MRGAGCLAGSILMRGTSQRDGRSSYRRRRTPSGSRKILQRPDRPRRVAAHSAQGREPGRLEAIRKGLRVAGPAVYGTSAAALQIRGKAAAPGSNDPEYRLRMARNFPVSKLRASLRKTSSGGLTINPPHQGAQRFKAVERIGRAFKLRAARHVARAVSWRRLDPRPARLRGPRRRRL